MSSIPSAWVTVSFNNVFRVKGGSQPPKSTFASHPREGYVRLLQIRDFEHDAKAVYIKDDKKWPKCNEQDVMIGRYGASVGKVLGGKAGAYNVALIRLIFDPAIVDATWARYLCKSAFFQEPLKSISRSAQNGFNKEDLSEIKFPFPPYEEQRSIAAKLDNLSSSVLAARGELERIPRLIQRYKQAVLKAAFRGDLTVGWREQHPRNAGDFLKRAGMSHLDSHDRPHLPKSWSWVTAGTLCEIKSGITLGKKRRAGTALVERPYLRVANVQRGWLNLDVIKTIEVTEKEATAIYLQPGDVLMNEGGDRDKLGRGWVWNGEIPQCIHQNHVFRLRPRIPQLSSKYISYYTNEIGQDYFLREGKQTTNLASISMSKISALPIPVPPADEMARIVTLIEDGFSAIDKIAIEANRAADLLDRLVNATLTKAFRGELPFPLHAS